MSKCVFFHGDFESAVQINPNIAQISFFYRFSKKSDFYKNSNFSKKSPAPAAPAAWPFKGPAPAAPGTH